MKNKNKTHNTRTRKTTKKRKERNATAVGVMLSEYTICAELPCYEPSVAKAWPQPIRHNKTEECCTRNENRNNKKNGTTTYLGANKRHVACITRVGPDSSHTVFIESITAAEASSKTHISSSRSSVVRFFFDDATSSANTTPPDPWRSVVCHGANRIPMLAFFLIFFFPWGGGGGVGECVWGVT